MARRFPRLLPHIFPSLREPKPQRRAGCPGDPPMECRVPTWAIGVGGFGALVWMGEKIFGLYQRDQALALKAEHVMAIERGNALLAGELLHASHAEERIREPEETRAQRG